MHKPPCVALFWFFWLLNVECVMDQKTGDVECHLHARNREIVCKQGGVENPTVDRLDVKPTEDAECMVPLVRW